MNDGSSAPALDDLPLTSSSSSSGGSEDHSTSGQEDATASPPDVSSLDETPESRVASKRHSKLLELLNAYDSLVYMELAVLYYLDTSTILIILRTLIHLTQISHARTLALARASRLNLKPAKTNIFLVLSINLLALCVHAFMAPAEASELTRGYLHGHLIVDLIGQKAAMGWLARARLCMMDCLVAVLQVIAVGIVGEVDRAEGTLEKVKHGGIPVRDSHDSTEQHAGEDRSTSAEDHGLSIFAFRRGRWQVREEDGSAGVELQDLSQARRTDTLREPNESDPQGGDPEQQRLRIASDSNLRGEYEIDEGESPAQVLDNISSGQVFLMRLRIADLLRDHFWEWRNRRLAGTV